MENIIVRVMVNEDGKIVLVGSNAPDGCTVEVVQVFADAAEGSRQTVPAGRFHEALTVVPPAPGAGLPTVEQVYRMSLKELLELLNRLTTEDLRRIGLGIEEVLRSHALYTILVNPADEIMVPETVSMHTHEALQGADAAAVREAVTCSVWQWLQVRFYDPMRPLPPHRFDELLRPENVLGFGRVVRLLGIAQHHSLVCVQFDQLVELVAAHNVKGVVLSVTGMLLIEETIRLNGPTTSTPFVRPSGSEVLDVQSFWGRLHIVGR